MRIIRVFPRRTKYTPTDPLSFIGDPQLEKPEADEVHISCTFTWDMEECERLRLAWSQYYPVVKVGGGAYHSPCDNFTPGMYINSGVTFTSRGCNNNCDWCHVRRREGKLYEIEIKPGNIIQDNNLLQCNKDHIEKVFDMLKTQRNIEFSGGLQADLITRDIVDKLRSISLYQFFTACDCKEHIPKIRKAGELLKDLPRNKKRCYVMIGKDESIFESTARLYEVWNAGFLPFSQLYQPVDTIDYDRSWKALNRLFSRPAAMKSTIG